jgi:hypothetical protein
MKPKQKQKVGKTVKRSALLRIYKVIKSEPERIWKATDFNDSFYYSVKTYLQTLLELGLIERKEISYNPELYSTKYNGKRTVCGFKLKSKEKK